MVRKNYDRSWSAVSEIHFIDMLGTHSPMENTSRGARSRRDWLKLYIIAHAGSRHEHHQAGLEYAWDQLRAMEGED